MACNGRRYLSDPAVNCEVCDGRGQTPVAVCPWIVHADPGVKTAIETYERAELGVYPNGVGWRHETTHTLEVIRVMKTEMNAAKHEREVKIGG